MLEQKFSLTNRRGQKREKKRSSESWQHKLDMRWAVIKLEKDEHADKEQMKPDIPQIEDEEAEPTGVRSVNQILRKLRMQATPESQEQEFVQERHKSA